MNRKVLSFAAAATIVLAAMRIHPVPENIFMMVWWVAGAFPAYVLGPKAVLAELALLTVSAVALTVLGGGQWWSIVMVVFVYGGPSVMIAGLALLADWVSGW